MKSFSQYLLEEQEISSLQTIFFKTMDLHPIFLDVRFWNRLVPESINRQAWHVTDAQGLRNLATNRKSNISTFTRMDKYGGALGGVETKGGVAVKVTGNTFASFNYDAYTYRTTGKWRVLLLKQPQFVNDVLDEYDKQGFSKERKVIEQMGKNILAEFEKWRFKAPEAKDENGSIPYLKQPESIDMKTKYRIFKGYLKIQNDWIEKRIKKVKAALEAPLDFVGYNEVIMNNPKIEKVYVYVQGSPFREDALKVCQDLKLPYVESDIDKTQKEIEKTY